MTPRVAGAERFKLISASDLTWDNKPLPPLLPLTPEQQRVLDGCLRDAADGKQLVKIDGLAGTGKTVVIGHLSRKLPGEGLVLCAPTGKAAGNLAARSGLPASTIDSAMHKFVRVKRGSNGRMVPVLEDKPDFRPQYLVLDEASMVERTLGNKLVARCSGTTFAFGDSGQLGPVQPADEPPREPWFVEPYDYEITGIMRQGAGSAIIKQARRVRHRGMYLGWTNEFEWAFEEAPELLDVDMVICADNVDRQRFNQKIRESRGFDNSMLYPGEPLMCWRNNRFTSVYNGTILTVRETWAPGQKLRLTDHRQIEMKPITNPLIEGFGDCPNFYAFRDRKDDEKDHKKRWTPFTLGYTCTVHKAQGSEWGNVLLVLRGGKLEDRKFLYTAITRAKEKITILHLSNATDRALCAYTPEDAEYDAQP